MAIIPPNIRVANNTKYILCAIRKKWLVLTPEEKVRQFILHRLINEQGYPQKYISVEKTLKVNELSKRYDIVVFNRALEPKILIECKAEYILMVTNGNTSFLFLINDETSTQINGFPVFEEL